MRAWLYVAALLLGVGAANAQSVTSSPGYPQYPTGFNSIDATLVTGADTCAKISAASTTLQATNALGGTIDASGGTTGVFACAASMFTSWPAAPFFGTVKLAAGWISTTVAQTVPCNAQVITPWLSQPITCANYQTISVAGTSIAPGSTAPVNPIAPAYFVSTSGSGSTCSAASPCSLTGAQTNAQTGAKTIYVRSGAYTPASAGTCGISGGNGAAVCVTSSDNGETWSFFPPDGYNSASIFGSSTSTTTGIDEIFDINGGSNITINGLTVHGVRYAGIEGRAASHNLLIENNIVFDNFNTVAGGNPGGFAFGDSSGVQILNNVVHDVDGFGMTIITSSGGSSMAGAVMANNVVYNYCRQTNDCGAYYTIDHDLISASGALIYNNYARDGGISAAGAICIYFDQGSQYGTAMSNVCAPNIGRCFEMNNTNAHNTYVGNICDLGSTAAGMAQFGGSMGLSNQVSGNIFIANVTGNPAFCCGIGTGPGATVTNNLYNNYFAASSINSSGDANPISQSDPLLSGCWRLQTGSPAVKAPIGMAPPPRGWGPPGYVVPAGSHAPSYASPSC